MWSGRPRTSASGTWWERKLPSAGSPSTSLGPVQPFGERRMIIGHAGRSAALPVRASRWMVAMSSSAMSTAAAMSWCMVAGSSPSTSSGR